MKFLMLDGALCRNKNISSAGKILISYLHNLKRANKCYYGGLEYLSDILGIKESDLSELIQTYCKYGLMNYCPEGLTITYDLNYYISFSWAKYKHEREN
jgi:hypothetical protein